MIAFPFGSSTRSSSSGTPWSTTMPRTWSGCRVAGVVAEDRRAEDRRRRLTVDLAPAEVVLRAVGRGDPPPLVVPVVGDVLVGVAEVVDLRPVVAHQAPLTAGAVPHQLRRRAVEHHRQVVVTPAQVGRGVGVHRRRGTGEVVLARPVGPLDVPGGVAPALAEPARLGVLAVGLPVDRARVVAERDLRVEAARRRRHRDRVRPAEVARGLAGRPVVGLRQRRLGERAGLRGHAGDQRHHRIE